MSCCDPPHPLLPQHSGDWRRWLPHVGPVWLGERFLRVWSPLSPVGLLHVEIPAQRRRQGRLQLWRQYLRCHCSCSYLVAAYLYNWCQCPSCMPTCLCSSVFAGPIITLESLGSGGPQSKLSKRHWLRLLKQPAVWWAKDKGSALVFACECMSLCVCVAALCIGIAVCLFSYSDEWAAVELALWQYYSNVLYLKFLSYSSYPDNLEELFKNLE